MSGLVASAVAAFFGKRGVVVWALMALLTLAFLYQSTLSDADYELLLLRWAVIPLEITGRDYDPQTPLGTPVTLVTALFLHADWLHLSGNLLYLWLFGVAVERALGRSRFLFLYLVGGVAGGLAHVAALPVSLVPEVGASTSVAAVMAAYLVLFPRVSLRLVVLAAWLVTQLLSGGLMPAAPVEAWAGGVAFWAHAGGLALGVALGLAMRRDRLDTE